MERYNGLSRKSLDRERSLKTARWPREIAARMGQLWLLFFPSVSCEPQEKPQSPVFLPCLGPTGRFTVAPKEYQFSQSAAALFDEQRTTSIWPPSAA